ncbi:unnamed protein product [Closterium sp. NIES-65]|nr:unnamed protein product [Closterium sp. NIES-65]CAI5979665.1 unnamed protein product [Closterium sp. NIES-65]
MHPRNCGLSCSPSSQSLSTSKQSSPHAPLLVLPPELLVPLLCARLLLPLLDRRLRRHLPSRRGDSDREDARDELAELFPEFPALLVAQTLAALLPAGAAAESAAPLAQAVVAAEADDLSAPELFSAAPLTSR